MKPKLGARARAPSSSHVKDILATTTTKAFEVSVTIPKVYRCYVPPPKQPKKPPIPTTIVSPQQEQPLPSTITTTTTTQQQPAPTASSSKNGSSATPKEPSSQPQLGINGKIDITSKQSATTTTTEASEQKENNSSKSSTNTTPTPTAAPLSPPPIPKPERIVVCSSERDGLVVELGGDHSKQAAETAAAAALATNETGQEDDKTKDLSSGAKSSIASTNDSGSSKTNNNNDDNNTEPNIMSREAFAAAALGSSLGSIPSVSGDEKVSELIGYVEDDNDDDDDSVVKNCKANDKTIKAKNKNTPKEMKGIQNIFPPKKKPEKEIDVVTAEEMGAVTKIIPPAKPSVVKKSASNATVISTLSKEDSNKGTPTTVGAAKDARAPLHKPKNSAEPIVFDAPPAPEPQKTSDKRRSATLRSSNIGTGAMENSESQSSFLRMVFGKTTQRSKKDLAKDDDDDDDDDEPGHRRQATHLTLMEYLTQEAAEAAIHESMSLRPGDFHGRNETSDEQDDNAQQPHMHNTEINVETLVILALKQLWNNGHLLSCPIGTSVRSILQLHGMDDNESMEFTFMAKEERIGIIMERLERIGVGSRIGTISFYKAELCRTAALECEQQPQETTSKNNPATPAAGNRDRANTKDSVVENERNNNIKEAINEWKDAASRLRVEQVTEQIHEQATMSFDYVSLLVIASILAGLGLIQDSAVVIVASMLVSPIMGPVMGMCFGIRIADFKLARFSFRNEIFSLLTCIGVGVVLSLICSWMPVSHDWPTPEMENRGKWSGLIYGIAIAIPSGMGVALSILGNNTSSLVGVAISASLLPPAVNAGLCWMHSLLLATGAIHPSDPTLISDIEDTEPSNFAKIGAVSLGLTFLNIVCIWISGVIMFQVKEVAPIKSKSAFWANDIKVARAIKTGDKEIDVDVIKAGLQNAIEKEERLRKQTADSTSTYSDNSKRGHKHHRKRWFQRNERAAKKHVGDIKATNINWNAATGPRVDELAMKETFFEDIISGHMLSDQALNAELAVMDTLLGFQDDINPTRRDEDDIEEDLPWFN